MGTINCGCGKTFSDSEIPCPHGSLLISEARLEQALDEIEGLDRHAEWFCDRVDAVVRLRGAITYRCPHCDRLLVFEDGLDKPAASYRRE